MQTKWQPVEYKITFDFEMVLSNFYFLAYPILSKLTSDFHKYHVAILLKGVQDEDIFKT